MLINIFAYCFLNPIDHGNVSKVKLKLHPENAPHPLHFHLLLNLLAATLDAANKATLQTSLNTAKGIFNDAFALKERFIIVYECVYDLKAWLIPEDFEVCHVNANSLYFSLGGLCTTIDTTLAAIDAEFKATCLLVDVEAKATAITGLDTEYDTANALVPG